MPKEAFLLDEQQALDWLIAMGEHPPYYGPRTREQVQWDICPVWRGSLDECSALLEDQQTGERRVYRDNPFSLFDSNGSCDCNRGMAFKRNHRKCTTGRYRVVAINGVEWREPDGKNCNWRATRRSKRRTPR